VELFLLPKIKENNMANTKPHASQIRYGSGNNTVDKTLKQSVLSYTDYATASAAPATLPDGQEIEAPNSDGRISRFAVQTGGLVFKDFVPDAIRLESYIAMRVYSGNAVAIDITTPGIAGRFYRDEGDVSSADNGGTVIVDSLGRRWKRLFGRTFNPAWFGAIGDGVADDKQAITDMLVAAGTSNILIDLGGKDYFVGSVSQSSGPVFTLTGCTGVTIRNPGKFIVTNAFTLSDTDVDWRALFRFIDCELVDVDVNVVGSSFDPNYPKGVTAVEVTTTLNSTKVSGYRIKSRLEKGVAAVEFNRPLADISGPLPANAARATDIVVDVTAKNTEYGLRCVGNGTNLHGEINTDSVVRSYFVTDTKQHKVNVNSYNHSKFTDVLIKSYFGDVSDIYVLYSATGFKSSSDSALTIEFQNDTENTSIKKIYVNVSIDGFCQYEPIIINRQYTIAGSIQPTTNSKMDDIFLDVSCPQDYSKDTVHVSSKSLSGGVVHINGKLSNSRNTNGVTFKRGNDNISINSGSYASEGGELSFCLDGIYVAQGGFFELEIFTDASWVDNATPEAYQLWSGRFSMTTDGSGIITDFGKQHERLFNGAVAPTISFPSFVGRNIKLAVTSPDCNTANSRLFGRMRVISNSI
jgi:hypothetical protein